MRKESDKREIEKFLKYNVFCSLELEKEDEDEYNRAQRYKDGETLMLFVNEKYKELDEDKDYIDKIYNKINKMIEENNTYDVNTLQIVNILLENFIHHNIIDMDRRYSDACYIYFPERTLEVACAAIESCCERYHEDKKSFATELKRFTKAAGLEGLSEITDFIKICESAESEATIISPKPDDDTLKR